MRNLSSRTIDQIDPRQEFVWNKSLDPPGFNHEIPQVCRIAGEKVLIPKPEIDKGLIEKRGQQTTAIQRQQMGTS